MKIEEHEKVDREDEKKVTAIKQEEREQQRADQAKSTRQVAKDLERTHSGKADDTASTVLFRRMNRGTFTNAGRTFKQHSWTSRGGQLSGRTNWLHR
jgi:hypothetical protein